MGVEAYIYNCMDTVFIIHGPLYMLYLPMKYSQSSVNQVSCYTKQLMSNIGMCLIENVSKQK